MKPRALFDVDETLIKDEPADWQRNEDAIEFDYYGMPRKRWPHKRHCELVKAHHARGFVIEVHSANGKGWCDEVIKKLGLSEYVHKTDDKPVVMFDDKEANEWCPRVWVEDK